MKHSRPLLISLFFISIVAAFSSCKGSAGKRAASEAAEFIEKRGSRLLEKEGVRVVEEEESEAARLLKAKRRADRVQNIIESFSDDGQEAQPQPVAVICSQCGWNGMVYLIDGYGNIVFDYYGNPQMTICPSCGGSGQQIVYQ